MPNVACPLPKVCGNFRISFEGYDMLRGTDQSGGE